VFVPRQASCKLAGRNLGERLREEDRGAVLLSGAVTLVSYKDHGDEKKRTGFSNGGGRGNR